MLLTLELAPSVSLAVGTADNIGWLKRKCNEQTMREHDDRVNWMFNWETEQYENLGPCSVCWAARSVP